MPALSQQTQTVGYCQRWTFIEKGKYKIKVLDLNTLSNSDTFNVFEYMHSELDVDRVLEAVTEATKEVEKRPGTIFG